MPFWDATESKLKMVVLFPHGIPNQTWYSPLKHNKKQDEEIIHSMVKRLKPHIKGYVKIQVYDNFTKELKYIYL